MELSEQLGLAQRPVPENTGGLLVKLLNLTHENYPGRDAQGILPLMVVGHEDMNRRDWARWLREKAVSAYGAGYAEKLVQTGVELKEMLPTAPIGREMRYPSGDRMRSTESHFRWIDRAVGVLKLVEQWPSLYNLITQELAEEEMTLELFVDRVQNMPAPREIGGRQYMTLGDLIGRGVSIIPNY